MKKLSALICAICLLGTSACGKTTMVYTPPEKTDANPAKTASATSDMPAAEDSPANPDINPNMEFYPAADPNERGNTPGNIMHIGRVAYKDNWAYISVEDGLYRERDDGSERQKINDDGFALFINVVGDWIYYAHEDENDEECLWRVRIDGTDKERLGNSSYNSYTTVIGDWIYFYQVDKEGVYDDVDNIQTEEGSICKMRTDGTDKKVLVEGNGIYNYFCVADDNYIYYNCYTDNTVHRVDLDGNNEETIAEANVLLMMTVSDGWLYFTEHFELYKVRTDGTDKTLINGDNKVFGFIVDDDYIYYTDFDKDNPSLSKCRLDGTGKTVLVDEKCVDIYRAGDWLYFTFGAVPDLTKNWHKVRTDGTDRQIA